ncbi:MAG: GHKL domain-containing protein [Balneolaceae bacterium]|nr:GHKL domain-containing protein [Balneolaceae bacterium]
MQKIFFAISVLLLFSLFGEDAFSQESTVLLSADMFDEDQVIFLTNLEGWVFKAGHDTTRADPNLITDDWEPLKPADLTFDYAKESTTFEGWFRIKFQVDSTLAEMPLYWRSGTLGAMDLYLDGELIQSYGKPSANFFSHRSYNPFNRIPDPAYLEPNREYVLAFYLVDHHSAWENRVTLENVRIDPWLRIAGPEYAEFLGDFRLLSSVFFAIWLTALFMLTVLFWTILFKAKNDTTIRLITWLNTLLFLSVVNQFLSQTVASGFAIPVLTLLFTIIMFTGLGLVPMVISQILDNEVPQSLKHLLKVYVGLSFVAYWAAHFAITAIFVFLIILISGYYIFKSWNKLRGSVWFVAGGLLLTTIWMLLLALYSLLADVNLVVSNIILTLVNLTLPFSLLLFVSVRFSEILSATRNKSREIVQLSKEKLQAEKEKQKMMEDQNILLENEVDLRTKELRESLANLQAAQEQLVQQEKLASLGQLTAGIAHEIKNPLNFVNNFSEVSLELIEEVREEVRNSPLSRGAGGVSGEADGGDQPQDSEADSSSVNTPLNPLSRGEAGSSDQMDLILEILDDIEANLKKIHEHGTRADGTVRSMLQHSRGGSGEMETADLNSIIKEYVNLSFHGMRAGKEPINVDIELDLDTTIGKIPLIIEDFSRVIVNLCNNAFDAMREKLNVIRSEATYGYNPMLTVRTHQTDKTVSIEIEDNGPGISDEIKNKILQPFFTTKKGTQGTGLGLSITNDIVKAHGGELSLTSNPQIGTKFRIAFPRKQ